MTREATTAEVRDWLPASAATHDAVQGRIAEVIDRWSRHWFAGAGVSLAGVELQVAGTPSPDAWRTFGRDLAIRGSPSTNARLAELALDASAGETVASAADRDVCEALANRIVADLMRKLGDAFGVSAIEDAPRASAEPAAEGRGGLTLSLAAEGRAPLAVIALSWRAILPFCKTSFAKPAAVRRPVSARAAAAAATPVVLEATLGMARIPLADLRCLAPGDVLVLDTTLEAGVTVSIASSDQIFARARVVEAEGRVGLAFHTGRQ